MAYMNIQPFRPINRPSFPVWAPGQFHQTSPDVRVGGGNHFWRRQGGQFLNFGTGGYGIDLNQRPGHQRGQDGVLVFDMNRNGKFDQKDVQNTNDMMKAATGNYDFNGDGRVSLFERLRGKALQKQFQKLDVDGDGRLSSHEIQRGGGGVWVDHNRNGRIANNEVHSPFNVPGQDAWGRRGPQTLNFVDPFSQTAHTSPNRPWYGGGYPGGCGCGFGNFQYGNRMPSFGFNFHANFQANGYF